MCFPLMRVDIDMGVYEDMANDAGYPYGTCENEQMANWIEECECNQARDAQEEAHMLEQMRSSKMLFKKKFLLEVLYGDHGDNIEVISDEIDGTRRWSIDHTMVFRIDDRYYETNYSCGATECQDEHPWEYDEDDIECIEVVPVTKTITVYEARK